MHKCQKYAGVTRTRWDYNRKAWGNGWFQRSFDIVEQWAMAKVEGGSDHVLWATVCQNERPRHLPPVAVGKDNVMP